MEHSPCGYEADAPGEGSVHSAHVGNCVEAEDCAGEQRQGFVVQLLVSQLDIKDVPSAAVQECKGLYEMFRKGEIKTSAGTAEEMNSASSSQQDDEEIPF